MAWTVDVRMESGNTAYVVAYWERGTADEFFFRRTLDVTAGGDALKNFKREAKQALAKFQAAETTKGDLATRIAGFLNG